MGLSGCNVIGNTSNNIKYTHSFGKNYKYQNPKTPQQPDGGILSYIG